MTMQAEYMGNTRADDEAALFRDAMQRSFEGEYAAPQPDFSDVMLPVHVTGAEPLGQIVAAHAFDVMSATRPQRRPRRY